MKRPERHLTASPAGTPSGGTVGEQPQHGDRQTSAPPSQRSGLADDDRQKARTSLRFWNDTDGMKRIAGVFDPDLGAEIEHEVRHKSEEKWRAERAGRTRARHPSR